MYSNLDLRWNEGWGKTPGTWMCGVVHHALCHGCAHGCPDGGAHWLCGILGHLVGGGAGLCRATHQGGRRAGRVAAGALRWGWSTPVSSRSVHAWWRWPEADGKAWYRAARLDKKHSSSGDVVLVILVTKSYIVSADPTWQLNLIEATILSVLKITSTYNVLLYCITVQINYRSEVVERRVLIHTCSIKSEWYYNLWAFENNKHSRNGNIQSIGGYLEKNAEIWKRLIADLQIKS